MTKSTQNDPEEESALLQAVLKTVVDAVITIDTSGNVKDANPAVLALFGYRREELIGRNVSILIPSPDRERHDQYIANFLRTGEAKIIGIGREVTALKKNGERIPVDLSVTEVLFDHTRLFTGIIRDMSERNRNRVALDREKSFTNSLVETAHAIILFLDTKGAIKRINPFLEELSGYKQHEVEGRHWFEMFIAPDEQAPLKELFEQTIAGTPVHSYVNSIKTRTGNRHIIAWSGKRLVDVDGTPTGILVVGNDITELDQTQQKLIQSERLAAIGQMVTGLAHESRNALQRAKASLEILSLDVSDQLHHDTLIKRALRAIEELHCLYEEVRNYAAPLKLKFETVDLAELTRISWQHLTEQWQSKHIHLKFPALEFKPVIMADDLKIQQVLRNILDNAIAASEKHSVITIDLQATTFNGEPAVQLIVTDEGTGMSAEQLSSIFTPFYTTKTKGTGLGMAITQRIIQEHNGCITAENAATGAKISVTLPVKRSGIPS